MKPRVRWGVRRTGAKGEATSRIVSYHAHLFTFPSRKAMAAFVSIAPPAAGALAFLAAWGPGAAPRGLLYGLLGLTAPLLASDVASAALSGGGGVLTPRRAAILSFVSCVVYVAALLSISPAVVLAGRPDLLGRGLMFAVAVNALLRQLILAAFPTGGAWGDRLAKYLQPLLCLASGAILLPITDPGVLAAGAAGLIIAILGVRRLILAVEGWRGGRGELRLLPMFRAFMIAWSDGEGGPLEEQITQVGEVRDLYVDALLFEGAEGGRGAALVVPYIHPGPFRSVGGSALPQALAAQLGERRGCVTAVPHGISTHRLDLTRSGEVGRIVEAVASSIEPQTGASVATPVVWAERRGAKASCQLFGDVALITLTMSPRSCDDLPEELGGRIMAAAGERGLAAVVVDSHNSIDLERGLEKPDEDGLFEAAVEALAEASGAPRRELYIGAARAVPSEWGVREGMGPGGVTVLVVRPEGSEAFAYVVVDGNNMRSGLRERLIEALRAAGIGDAEILTTDTHVVNAIGATTHGYHPIGVAMEERRLTEYIVEAATAAISRMARSRAIHSRTLVRGLTVLGEGGLELLSGVLESGFGLFRRAALINLPPSLILAAAVIFFS